MSKKAKKIVIDSPIKSTPSSAPDWAKLEAANLRFRILDLAVGVYKVVVTTGNVTSVEAEQIIQLAKKFEEFVEVD